MAQFFGHDERRLIHNAGNYLAEGLYLGCGLLVVTGDDRRAALFRELEDLGVAPAAAIRTGRLRVEQSHAMLSSLRIAGKLDYERFEGLVRPIIEDAQAACGGKGVRVYGDMVDDLWEAGSPAETSQLEQFWNRLQQIVPFDLFCAYSLSADLGHPLVAPIVREHTAVFPAHLEYRAIAI